MKVILYLRDSNNNWFSVANAITEKEVDEMMRYASYKVRNGYDVKIEQEIKK